MPTHPSQIVYGVFKGMGDLLWAVPVIRSELSRGNEVHLILFPSGVLQNLCSLIDFGPRRDLLSILVVPRTFGEAFAWLRQMSHLSPKTVWISPHAPISSSSWKVPLLFWMLKQFFWRRATIVGASKERFARLLDLALPVDYMLPLKFREWSMYLLYRNGEITGEMTPPRFESEIMLRTDHPSDFDLVIHPGATAANRLWPHSKYPCLINLLPTDWRIGVLGLPGDVESLRTLLPAARSIEFITGSLREALLTLASARRLLVMDSGTVHFAEVLQRPTVAVFGKDDPATIVPQGFVQTVFERTIHCQPCGLKVCFQTEPFCITNVSAASVARRIVSLSADAKPIANQHDATALVSIQER